MCPTCGNKSVLSRNNGMLGYRCNHCGYTEDMGGGALDGYSDKEYSEMRCKAIADPKSPKEWVKTLVELENEYQQTIKTGVRYE